MASKLVFFFAFFFFFFFVFFGTGGPSIGSCCTTIYQANAMGPQNMIDTSSE